MGARQFYKSVDDCETLKEIFLCWSCDQQKRGVNSLFKIISDKYLLVLLPTRTIK